MMIITANIRLSFFFIFMIPPYRGGKDLPPLVLYSFFFSFCFSRFFSFRF